MLQKSPFFLSSSKLLRTELRENPFTSTTAIMPENLLSKSFPREKKGKLNSKCSVEWKTLITLLKLLLCFPPPSLPSHRLLCCVTYKVMEKKSFKLIFLVKIVQEGIIVKENLQQIYLVKISLISLVAELFFFLLFR